MTLHTPKLLRFPSLISGPKSTRLGRTQANFGSKTEFLKLGLFPGIKFPKERKKDFGGCYYRDKICIGPALSKPCLAVCQALGEGGKGREGKGRDGKALSKPCLALCQALGEGGREGKGKGKGEGEGRLCAKP